jgi:DNA-binding NtrC family response regulator
MTKMSQNIPQKNIDLLLDEKFSHLIGNITSRFLGVHVDELNKDLTTKLTKSPFIDFEINTKIPFKEAKKRFKKYYLKKLLSLNLGNISEVAKKSKINRRSLHRLITELNINIKKIKKDLIRPYEIKVSSVSNAIENVLDDYKRVIHPDKLESIYKSVHEISHNLMKEVPDTIMPLKDAIAEFEKRYLQKALIESNHNIAVVARRIQLRYETLHRKLRSLRLI